MKTDMPVARQVLVFIMVGATSALVDTAVMQLLLLQGVAVWLSVAIGFATGLVVNYLSHARFTFGGPVSLHTGMKFAVVVGFNYLMTLGFVHVAQSLIGSPLAGKIASLPFVAAAGFLASRAWVFK